MLAVILIIGHLLADFFFQPSFLAEKKKASRKYLFLHSGIYLLVFILICSIFLKLWAAVLTVLTFSATHLLIDFFRVKVEKRIGNSQVLFISFLIDQILHIGIIVITYYALNLNMHGSSIYLSSITSPIFKEVILIMFLFIALLDPAAVFIKKWFAVTFENGSADDGCNQNVGSMIGKLERIIIAIFILCSQYGAIGLVLTAKSIARFKQLEEKDFAEKYLVGTLTSLTISLLLSLIIKLVIGI